MTESKAARTRRLSRNRSRNYRAREAAKREPVEGQVLAATTEEAPPVTRRRGVRRDANVTRDVMVPGDVTEAQGLVPQTDGAAALAVTAIPPSLARPVTMPAGNTPLTSGAAWRQLFRAIDAQRKPPPMTVADAQEILRSSPELEPLFRRITRHWSYDAMRWPFVPWWGRVARACWHARMTMHLAAWRKWRDFRWWWRDREMGLLLAFCGLIVGAAAAVIGVTLIYG
jgi:hypothetical protein